MINYKPKFTIWVINFNKHDLTLMTLRSLRTRYLCDVVLINTGEMPDPKDYPEIYDLIDMHITLPNISLAATWNYIFINSLTDYNFIFNNDVLLTEYTIDTLWDRRKSAGLVSCFDISPIINIERNVLNFLYVLDEWPRYQDMKKPEGLDPEADFSGFLLNKSTWAKAGGFDEDFKIAYFEDLDFKQKLWDKGISYCAVKEACFYHIGQQSSNQKAHLQEYYSKNQARYQNIWKDKVVRLNYGGLNMKKYRGGVVLGQN